MNGKAASRPQIRKSGSRRIRRHSESCLRLAGLLEFGHVISGSAARHCESIRRRQQWTPPHRLEVHARRARVARPTCAEASQGQLAVVRPTGRRNSDGPVPKYLGLVRMHVVVPRLVLRNGHATCPVSEERIPKDSSARPHKSGNRQVSLCRFSTKGTSYKCRIRTKHYADRCCFGTCRAAFLSVALCRIGTTSRVAISPSSSALLSQACEGRTGMSGNRDPELSARDLQRTCNGNRNAPETATATLRRHTRASNLGHCPRSKGTRPRTSCTFEFAERLQRVDGRASTSRRCCRRHAVSCGSLAHAWHPVIHRLTGGRRGSLWDLGSVIGPTLIESFFSARWNFWRKRVFAQKKEKEGTRLEASATPLSWPSEGALSETLSTDEASGFVLRPGEKKHFQSALRHVTCGGRCPDAGRPDLRGPPRRHTVGGDSEC
jgi:hypothetical protein